MSRRFIQPNPVEAIRELYGELTGTHDRMFVGIDPGLSGAIAFVPSRPSLYQIVVDMPVYVERVKSSNKKSKTGFSDRHRFDYAEISKLFDTVVDNSTISVVVIEKSEPHPGDSPMTAYGVAASFHMFPLYFQTFGIRYEVERPSVWKRRMQLTNKDKDASRQMACRLFPHCSHYLTHVSDDGRAEALLIAEDTRRKYQGGAR